MIKTFLFAAFPYIALVLAVVLIVKPLAALLTVRVLGESLATVEKHDTPLEEATTPSEPGLDVLPLGSGALAGTTFPIDRAYVARRLGFSTISANSMDAVSDRDFVVEFCAAAALLGVDWPPARRRP